MAPFSLATGQNHNQLKPLNSFRVGLLAYIWVRSVYRPLFEDNSDTPYALHILAEQSDRQVPPSDMGRHILFSAWGPDRLLFKRPARLRSAARLPYLKPWETP